MPYRSTRRTFVKSIASAGAVLPLVAPRLVRAASTNGQLAHASIGVDGMGWGDIQSIAANPLVRIVAICDIDTSRQRQAAAKFPQAKRYQHWQELLEKEGERIDSVNVTVPDHMHAPISMSAMRLGKHVYCQKPLTHSIYEVRQMRLESERRKVVTQMGTQGHAHVINRMLVMLVQQGVIGKITAVHAWTNRPAGMWPQGVDRPTNTAPPPRSLDWDAWLGVAPERPYVPDVYAPFKWRGWLDFGTGSLGDIGCHAYDPIYTALKLTDPTSVISEGPAPNDETYPLWDIIRYQYPATPFTVDGGITLHWYDGGKLPAADAVALPEGIEFSPGGGKLFVGETGALLSQGISAPMLVRNGKREVYEDLKLPAEDHYLRWTNACLGTDTAECNFSFSGPLTEAVLLGNVAMHYPNQNLLWDANAMRITNLDAANARLRRDYRSGWEIPGLS